MVFFKSSFHLIIFELIFLPLVVDLLSFILLHLEQFIFCVGVYLVRFVAFCHTKPPNVIVAEEKVVFFFILLHFPVVTSWLSNSRLGIPPSLCFVS